MRCYTMASNMTNYLCIKLDMAMVVSSRVRFNRLHNFHLQVLPAIPVSPIVPLKCSILLVRPFKTQLRVPGRLFRLRKRAGARVTWPPYPEVPLP